MIKPKLLDLFCGAGGASMGYHRAGFDVTGVDIKPQPHYPFKFIQADAMTFPLEGYDVIHASPPCQSYSMISRFKRTKKRPMLIGELREKLINSKLLYIIENVEGSPLINPLMLCGSHFSLGVIRHRLFETNSHKLTFKLIPNCNHANMYDPWHYAVNEREQLSRAMGIDWFMKREEVREAIPPAYTEWIGKQLLFTKKEDLC